MKVLLLAIGKRHDPALTQAIEDYSKRLTHYATLSWQLLDPARGKRDVASGRHAETAALMAELLPDDYVVLLDERGKQLSSPGLAELLQAQQLGATKRVVFIIGGAHGVADSLRERSDFVWSMSGLVFPHQLVRLILVEQLYRAFTIINNEPYHHG